MLPALLAVLFLVPSLALAQVLFKDGEPYMTVTDASQAKLAGGPKKGAPQLAVGNKVFLHSVTDGWATVELEDPQVFPVNAHRYRLPFAALASQPGKTFMERPAWAPAPGDPALAARDVVGYEDGPWIMVREGAALPRRIAKGRGPAVSPDASLLAYVPDAGGGIVVVDLTGKAKPRHIATNSNEVGALHFTPDGRRLAWQARERGDGKDARAKQDGIEMADLSRADPKPAVVVPNLPAFDAFQGFTRDGTALVFFTFGSESSTVRWVGLDGKILRQEPAATFTESTSASSADKYLPSPADDNLLLAATDVKPTPAMMWLHDTGGALFLYDAGSGTNYRLTPRQIVAAYPAWTPDGRRIYFSGLKESPPAERHTLFRMNADGTGLMALGRGIAPSVGTRP
jgi:Tol biopolymer transport system component